MRVRCSHGYFFFYEENAGDASRFASMYGFSLAPKNEYYTFETLVDAPSYSFKNLKYISTLAIATETFSGVPWDVMRKNKLIYDFTDDTVKLRDTVMVPAKVNQGYNYFFTDGLLLPGSINSRGQRVTDYTAFFAPDALKFRYTEVLYDNDF